MDVRKQIQEEDIKYEDVVAYVKRCQRVSVFKIMEKFSVGSAGAYRFIKKMEDEGLVGPPEGTRFRRVLKPRRTAKTKKK